MEEGRVVPWTTVRREKPQGRKAWKKREIFLELITAILTHGHTCVGHMKGLSLRLGTRRRRTSLFGVGGDMLGDPAETGFYF